MKLQRRLDALETIRVEKRCCMSRIDWSGVTDAELDRLEALAMQAETSPDAETFRVSLAPEDRGWLDAVGERLGTVVAVSGKQS